MAQLLKKCDTNNDGVIEWGEFVNALSEWITEEEKVETGNETIGSKRKGAPSSPLQVTQFVEEETQMRA